MAKFKEDINIDGSGYFDKDLEVTGLSNQAGIYSIENGVVDVLNPKGGLASFSSSNTGGAIKIKLPRLHENGVFKFWVDIKSFDKGGFSILIDGFEKVDGSFQYPGVKIVGDNLSQDFSIRFGYDTTSDCIWIGEVDTTWGHINVGIRDFQVSADPSIEWAENWNISLVTAFDTVQVTKTNNFIWGDWNKLKGKPTGIWHEGNLTPDDYLKRDGSLPMTGSVKVGSTDFSSELGMNDLLFNRVGVSYIKQLGGGNLVFQTTDSGTTSNAMTLDTSQNAHFHGNIIKSGSSDSYMLLGGGGTKALSDFNHWNEYSATNGVFVKTDIPANSNTMFYLDIKGNGYAGDDVVQITLQGYNNTVNDIIKEVKAKALGTTPNIKLFNYDGVVCFWWEQTSTYQSYSVFCNVTMYASASNRVTNITNEAFPSTGVTRLISIIPTRVWDNDNLDPVNRTGTQTITGVKNFIDSLTIKNTKNGTWAADELKGVLNFYGSDISGSGPGNHAWIKALSTDQYGVATEMIFGTSSSGGEATERMRIDKNGDVTVQETLTASIVYATGGSTSLRSLKKNIKPFKGSGLSLIKDYKFYDFDYKNEDKGTGMFGIMLDEAPEKIIMDEEHLNINNVIFINSKAIQELSATIEKQQNQIDRLEKLVEKLLGDA